MIVVVEVASRAGTRAWKEYDASTFNAAVEAAKRELRPYPKLRVTDVWIKGDRTAEQEPEEEW
jgi:hypothetical protein